MKRAARMGADDGMKRAARMGADDGMKRTVAYDAAELLKTDENVVAYFNAALDSGDLALVSAALGDIARTRGIIQSQRHGHHP